MSAFSPLPAKAVLLKVMVETRRRSASDSTHLWPGGVAITNADAVPETSCHNLNNIRV